MIPNLAEQRRHLKRLLLEKEERRKALEVSISNSLLVINAKANPFIEELCDLDVDAILTSSQALATQVKELREVVNKMKAITKELL